MAFSNDWGIMDSEGFNSYRPVQSLESKEGKRKEGKNEGNIIWHLVLKRKGKETFISMEETTQESYTWIELSRLLSKWPV